MAAARLTLFLAAVGLARPAVGAPTGVLRDDRPWHGARTASAHALLAANEQQSDAGYDALSIEHVLFGVMTSAVHGRRARAVKATWCGAEGVKCVFFSETDQTAREVQPVVTIQAPAPLPSVPLPSSALAARPRPSTHPFAHPLAPSPPQGIGGDYYSAQLKFLPALHRSLMRMKRALLQRERPVQLQSRE